MQWPNSRTGHKWIRRRLLQHREKRNRKGIRLYKRLCQFQWVIKWLMWNFYVIILLPFQLMDKIWPTVDVLSRIPHWPVTIYRRIPNKTLLFWQLNHPRVIRIKLLNQILDAKLALQIDATKVAPLWLWVIWASSFLLTSFELLCKLWIESR